MEKLKGGNPLFSKFDHVGVVVRNIDEAIKHYQSLGIGPFIPVTTAVTEKNSMRNIPMNTGSKCEWPE